MVATKTRNSSARPPRWPLSEKKRIVELTHGKGASVAEIALAHGLHPTVLSRWRSLYRTGKLSDAAQRKRSSTAEPGTALLPVMISTRSLEDAAIAQTVARSRRHENAVVHIGLSSGATIRIETDSLDATFVCALLAELRG